MDLIFNFIDFQLTFNTITGFYSKTGCFFRLFDTRGKYQDAKNVLNIGVQKLQKLQQTNWGLNLFKLTISGYRLTRH